jgi:hypothetical protein
MKKKPQTVEIMKRKVTSLRLAAKCSFQQEKTDSVTVLGVWFKL